MTNEEDLFTRAGGEASVRAIIEDFVTRMMNDVMIGFFFAGVDRQQLVERELQFTARFLGSTSHDYTGRTMRAAHAAHRIMGGQFDRRKHILRQVLHDHTVPDDVVQVWLDHVESLRDQVTADSPGSCD